MKKLVRILVVALTLALMVGIVACGNADDGGTVAQPPAADDAPAATPTPAPAPPTEPADPADPVEPTDPVTATGLPVPNRPMRVVYTMFNGLNPVAREIEGGFITAAGETGIDLWVMDNQLDPIQMHANVDMAIMAGDVDFFILYTNDIATNPGLMDKLIEAGIPTMTIATAAIGSCGTEAPLIFNQDDNWDSAYKAARELALAAQARGWTEDQIVFISMGFLEAGGVFLTRTQGAEAGIRSVFPNIHQYIETSSTGSTEVAFQRTADYLLTIPEGKKILGWTHSDDVTASMLAAIEGAGRVDDALLVSNGLSMQMLDMLRDPDGIIVGSIDMNWAQFGPTMLTKIINYLNDGTPIPLDNNAPWEFLTPETVNYKYPPN